jgi:hypothetical protein
LKAAGRTDTVAAIRHRRTLAEIGLTVAMTHNRLHGSAGRPALHFIPQSTNQVFAMSTLLRIALILAALIIVGGVVLLATVDLQPPTQRIEKTIPNDRFQR